MASSLLQVKPMLQRFNIAYTVPYTAGERRALARKRWTMRLSIGAVLAVVASAFLTF